MRVLAQDVGGPLQPEDVLAFYQAAVRNWSHQYISTEQVGAIGCTHLGDSAAMPPPGAVGIPLWLRVAVIRDVLARAGRRLRLRCTAPADRFCTIHGAMGAAERSQFIPYSSRPREYPATPHEGAPRGCAVLTADAPAPPSATLVHLRHKTVALIVATQYVEREEDDGAPSEVGWDSSMRLVE